MDAVGQFPKELTTELNRRHRKWGSCQEALDDLMEIANEMEKAAEAPFVAKSPSKNSAQASKAGLVAVAEPAPTDETEGPAVSVAAVMPRKGRKETVRCYFCKKPGHIWRRCPTIAEEVAKSMSPKN